VDFIVERPWERREAFLALNAAGEVPVLMENEGVPLCGPTVIMEYLDETRGYAMAERRLMPGHPDLRAEMRRLVDWCTRRTYEEATRVFEEERIFKMEQRGSPDTAVLRQARANVRFHVAYLGWLAGGRDWLAGKALTYADFAAAAQLSVLDYLGEVPWDASETARSWYARLKSRPSFRPLLADKVAGLPPSSTYLDLDF
jgi:glutathione S-transferase